MIKPRTTLILLFATLAIMPLMAQKRSRNAKTPEVPFTEQVEQALATYDFQRATELIDQEAANLRRKRKATTHLEPLYARARQGLAKLHATERIVVIDSVLCPKDEALKHIRLSHESGRINTYAATFLTNDQSEATAYENELGNKRYMALPADMRLAFADKIADQWSEPVLLTGLNDNDSLQNYPFLLADGITLYYAASGAESLGGYDIFVSRADGEDGSFLTPENIGFPFNSTANDYLLAIDEMSQLGWFVSDRCQPEGQVCVYVFIPSDTREVYGDEVDDEQLRHLARLTSLRDTWMNAATDEEAAAITAQGLNDNTTPAAITRALQRLADLRSGKSTQKEAQKHDFYFVVNDSHVYTSLEQFHSPQARQLMQQWQSLSQTERTESLMLQRLRDNYATANDDERKKLATTILQIEKDYYPLLDKLKQLAKDIRKAENAQ